MDLLREIVPDVREALNLTEGFGMEPPGFDLRDWTDAATAECILSTVSSGGTSRSAMLRGLEAPVVEQAIVACRSNTPPAMVARHRPVGVSPRPRTFSTLLATSDGYKDDAPAFLDSARSSSPTSSGQQPSQDSPLAVTAAAEVVFRGCFVSKRDGLFSCATIARRERHPLTDYSPARAMFGFHCDNSFSPAARSATCNASCSANPAQ